MKKLSAEEKADRYDRAIEIIKDHYQKIRSGSLSRVSNNIEVFEKAFPELKEEESEDKRIMEDIITYLSTVEDREFIPYETWISWIKKRGEQKPDKVEPKFRVGCVIQHIKPHDNIPLRVVYIGAGSYQCESDDLKIYCSFPIKEQDEWELIEQKPVIEMKTPEESLGVDSDTYNKIVDECVYDELKSAWSEEDETYLEHIIIAVKNCYKDDKGEENPFREPLLSWLKSLRPQNRWKPSDKQIEVCKKVYADILSVRGFDLATVNSELNRLEKQLKQF